MVRPKKRAAGGVAALAVLAGAMMAFAPQAQAAPVTTRIKCTFDDPTVKAAMGVPFVEGDQAFTVTGPAEATPNAAVKINVDPGVSPASSPIPAKVKITPTVVFDAKSDGGTAKLTAVGATATMDVEQKVGIDVPAFDANIRVPGTAKGKLELMPKGFSLKIQVLEPEILLKVPCETTKAAPVAYSLNVKAAASTGGGSTPTATASSTPSTGTSGTGDATAGGSLPKTGPLDDAVSMGLLGGTVGLLGIGGVLLATRRVRASRNA